MAQRIYRIATPLALSGPVVTVDLILWSSVRTEAGKKRNCQRPRLAGIEVGLITSYLLGPGQAHCHLRGGHSSDSHGNRNSPSTSREDSQSIKREEREPQAQPQDPSGSNPSPEVTLAGGVQPMGALPAMGEAAAEAARGVPDAHQDNAAAGAAASDGPRARQTPHPLVAEATDTAQRGTPPDSPFYAARDGEAIPEEGPAHHMVRGPTRPTGAISALLPTQKPACVV